MKLQVVTQSRTFTANTTIMPDGFCGWYAKNIGTANVKVDGFVLEPSQSLDLTHIGNVLWSSPIPVEVSAGGVLRIMRLKYNETDGE